MSPPQTRLERALSYSPLRVVEKLERGWLVAVFDAASGADCERLIGAVVERIE